MSAKSTLTVDEFTLTLEELTMDRPELSQSILSSADENSQSLIQPTNLERVLGRLNEFKVENLNSKEREELDKAKINFIAVFCKLCLEEFSVSRDNLKTFSREELRVISDELAKRIKPRYRLAEYLQLPVFALGLFSPSGLGWWFGAPWPGVGILMLLGIIAGAVLSSIVYSMICSGEKTEFYEHRRRLLKAYGEKYFPEKLDSPE